MGLVSAARHLGLQVTHTQAPSCHAKKPGQFLRWGGRASLPIQVDSCSKLSPQAGSGSPSRGRMAELENKVSLGHQSTHLPDPPPACGPPWSTLCQHTIPMGQCLCLDIHPPQRLNSFCSFFKPQINHHLFGKAFPIFQAEFNASALLLLLLLLFFLKQIKS